MSVYMTEDEQLESIKKWWGKYGTVITLCISLVLLTVAGFKYMHWHQEKLMQQASITYENMMNEFSNHRNKAVRSYANQLIKNYDHTVYSDVAHMTLAKIYMSKDKLDTAKDELQVVANTSKMTALKQIAKIRIARILAADKSYAAALNELSVIVDNAYLPVINELKGDIYSAKGEYKEAISAYRLAIDEVKSNGMTNLFLEMKSNELGTKHQTKSNNEGIVKSV